MSSGAWWALGRVASILAGRMVGGTRRGAAVDTTLGLLGVLVGGAAFQRLGRTGVTGFDAWSVYVATVGTVVVLVVYHALHRS